MKEFPYKKAQQLSLGSDFDVIHHVSKGHIENMHPVYQAAHKKALGIVGGGRIHLDDFNYVDVEQDKLAVLEKCRAINSKTFFKEGEAEAIVQAEILEAMLYDLIRNHKWFGDHASAILPSSFDDLFLGNDIILEQSNGDFTSYSGIGIDVTIGEKSFVEKFEKTKEWLGRGQLGRVKYFKSRDANYVGELNNIPHFVIGLDREKMFALTKAWVEGNAAGLIVGGLRQGVLKLMIAECDEFSKIGNQKIKEAYQREKRLLETLLAGIKN